MSWAPSAETLLILRQVGYVERTLVHAVEAYQKIASKRYNDKGFINFLRSHEVSETVVVENTLKLSTQWYPSSVQIQSLVDEGYWRALIMNQLGSFLFGECDSPTVVLSQFKLFQRFLQRRIPLQNLSIENWTPSPVLSGVISTELVVETDDYPIFWEAFRRAYIASGAEFNLIPRYFFNFIEKNQKAILAKKQLMRSLN